MCVKGENDRRYLIARPLQLCVDGDKFTVGNCCAAATRVVDGLADIVDLVIGGASVDVTRALLASLLGRSFKVPWARNVCGQLLLLLTALFDVVPM